MDSFNTYFGPRRIFLYHLTGALDLTAGVAGFKTETFLEGDIGFRQSKTDSGSTKIELAIFQIGWFF